MRHYGHMIRILHCSASQVLNKALSDMELTSSQGHIMGYLAHCSQPPCPKDIEEQFQLSHPTISGILARLEKKDFVRLLPDPEDRRCKRVYIQPKGQASMQTMHRAIADMEEQMVKGFTEAEKQQFTDFLLRATQNMGGDPCRLKEETQE